MASELLQNTRRQFLASSNVCTPVPNTPAPASAWLSVNESLTGIEDESGSNPNPVADRLSDSPSPTPERSSDNLQILIVEDNPADVFLIRDAIKVSGVAAHVHVINNGEDAIRFFDSADTDDSAPCPGVVILDINLPKIQGKQVLQHLRQSRRCREAVVIVASTSNALEDRRMAFNTTGTNAYFRKPSAYDDFMKLGVLIRDLFPKRSQP